MLYYALRAAAGAALRWHYADVVVQGSEHVPADGPVLVVANHPNALVDALVVATSLPRRVRLTAKATLFGNRLLAPLLHAVGVVPLQRAKDVREAARQGTTAAVSVARNADAFRRVTDTLRAGGMVLVFPEGISHDTPALAPLRTGAARMALEADDAGIAGVRLLPVGMVFEEKERPGSRVLVRIGEAVDVHAWRAMAAGRERALPEAQALTALADERLRALTLNFASDARARRAVSLARALALLAEQSTPVRDVPPLVAEAAIAARIERALDALPAADTALATRADALAAAVEALEHRLAAAGIALADLRISPEVGPGARFVAREGVLALAGAPVALFGRVMHWLPIRLARAVAMRSLAGDPSRDQPAMRTIVLGLAAVLAWYAAQAVLVARWLGAVPALLWLVAIFSAARVDLHWGPRLARARRRARSYLALRRDPARRDEAVREADRLVTEAVEVEAALLASSER